MLFIYKYRRAMIISHNEDMVDFSNILALKQELLIASLRAENEDEIDQLKLWVAQLELQKVAESDEVIKRMKLMEYNLAQPYSFG